MEGNPAPASRTRSGRISISAPRRNAGSSSPPWIPTFRHVHPHEPPRSMTRIEDRRRTPASVPPCTHLQTLRSGSRLRMQQSKRYSGRLPYRDLARTSLSYQHYHHYVGCRLPVALLSCASTYMHVLQNPLFASSSHHSVRSILNTGLGGACYVSTLVHTHRYYFPASIKASTAMVTQPLPPPP